MLRGNFGLAITEGERMSRALRRKPGVPADGDGDVAADPQLGDDPGADCSVSPKYQGSDWAAYCSLSRTYFVQVCRTTRRMRSSA